MKIRAFPVQFVARVCGGYICPLLITLAVMVLLGGCAHHSGQSRTLDVFIPPHPPLVAPGPEIPVQVAALSGVWEGTWRDGIPSALLVLRLDRDFARLLLASGTYGDDMHLPRSQWFKAQLVAGDQPRLEWKGYGAEFVFRMSSDGTRLSGTFREPQSGGALKTDEIIMTRRVISEKDRVTKAEHPFVCAETAVELKSIQAEPDPASRRGLVDAFMKRARQKGLPLVESGSRPELGCVTYLYRGPAQEVALSGTMNGGHDQKDYLTQVAGADLFFFSQEYPDDARLEYNLVADGTRMLDPLNSRIVVYGKGKNSELSMPKYVPPPEVVPDPQVPKGEIEELLIEPKLPDTGRKVTVYLPAGYKAGSERYPVLYLNDAFGALKFGSIVTILDNLIGTKVIPPLIAVLVPSVKDRIVEYGMNPAFEAFFTGSIVPAVDARYRTIPVPEKRAIGGISAGATAALSLAIGHPDIFGKCIAQSTATRLEPLLQLAHTGPARPIRAYLDVGRFESDFYGSDLVNASRRLRDILLSHGCSVRYQKVNEGHGWVNWRARTRDALTFLFTEPDAGR